LGNPTKLNDWVGHYAEWASFIGVIPLLFSLQVFPRWKEKRIAFFLSASVFTLLFSLQSPLLQLLSSLHIPVLSSSYPTRIIVLASFSVATTVTGPFGAKKPVEVIKLVINKTKQANIRA
jgi:hypothetical protein